MELQFDEQTMDQIHELLVSKSSSPEPLPISVRPKRRYTLPSWSTIRPSIDSTSHTSSVSPGFEPATDSKLEGLGLNLDLINDEPISIIRPAAPAPLALRRFSTCLVPSTIDLEPIPPSPTLEIPESPCLGLLPWNLDAISCPTTPYIYSPIPLSRRSSIASLPSLPDSPPYSRTASPVTSRASSPEPTSSGAHTPGSGRSISMLLPSEYTFLCKITHPSCYTDVVGGEEQDDEDLFKPRVFNKEYDSGSDIARCGMNESLQKLVEY